MQATGPSGPTTSGRCGRTGVARLGAILALAIVLQACDEGEQDRPLGLEKGSYQGQPDQKLDQDQIEALRQRASGHQL